MHLCDHVDAVKHDPLAWGRPERGVQSCTVLAAVDQVAAKHRGGPPGEIAVPGQRHEQLQRCGVDPVLRVIEVQAGRLERESRPSLRVGGEELAEMPAANECMMREQRLPGSPRCKIDSRREPGVHFSILRFVVR